MKSLISVLLLTAVVSVGFCQTNSADAQGNMQSLASGGGMFRSFDNRAKGTKGSNMIFEEYLPGGIVMNEGHEFDFNRMNYDGYFDAIVVIRQKTEQVVTTMMVKGFYIVDVIDTLRFDRLLRTDNRMGYYQRLTSGQHVKLYKKLFTTTHQATWTGAYSLGSTQDEIVQAHAYYVVNGEMRPKEFKNKKMLIEIFPEFEDQISEYFKQFRPDFKKENEVIALIAFIDSVKGKM